MELSKAMYNLFSMQGLPHAVHTGVKWYQQECLQGIYVLFLV